MARARRKGSTPYSWKEKLTTGTVALAVEGRLRNDAVREVKPQLEEKEGKTFDVFTAVEFKTQVVAGTNYFIKVHVGNDEFMHLRVFRSLPHENKPLSLHSYQSSKMKHDELTFF
ncbi:PREDICTED: cystatin-B-like [Charadrius vociferus]|uniref:cystatin-B-like n=1 Tax=Charadrius vociferus TaxID=50402 RepID=UPI0005213671|nr:PREDICTED: cystatin-B-like [Charadrius vociferus]